MHIYKIYSECERLKMVALKTFIDNVLFFQKNVCDFLREKVKIAAGDEQLHTLTGILDVNCHEVKFSIPGNSYYFNLLL